MTNADFLQLATAAAALASSRTSGLPAGITVAQAALESAFGRSRLSREAHNYFGIKAHRDHAWIELPTWEVVDNKRIRTSARFARYESMAACFADRDRLILTLPCYAAARAASSDPEAFTRELARRWATDPSYADKVLSIYRKFHLDQI